MPRLLFSSGIGKQNFSAFLIGQKNLLEVFKLVFVAFEMELLFTSLAALLEIVKWDSLMSQSTHC